MTDRRNHRHSAAPKADVFPPLSISLEAFLSDGSDWEFRRMMYSFLQASSLILRAREQFAAYIGVSAPQYSMLMAIAESGETTVGDLAALMHVSSPFVTSEISKLIRGGYVNKRRNENDRRSALLSLTDAGRALVRRVSPMRRTANDVIFGGFTPEQAKMLRHIVEILVDNSEHAIHELAAPRWWQSPAAPADDVDFAGNARESQG